MKKLLAIVVLGLLWHGNAFANKNIENSIENCADDRFINKTKLNKFTPMLYLLNPKFQELEKESKSLEKKIQSTNSQFKTESQKWKKDNPKPHMGIEGETNLEKFKIKEKKWLIDSNKANLEILDRLDGGATKRLKEVQKQITTLIRSQASKYITSKEFDLKFKAKNINGYLNHYTICEKKYQETPSSFKLKWSD